METSTARNNNAEWLWIVLIVASIGVPFYGAWTEATFLSRFEIGLIGLVLAVIQAGLIALRTQAPDMPDDYTLKGLLYAAQTIIWVALLFSNPIWYVYLPILLIQLHRDLPIRIAAGFDLIWLGAGGVELSQIWGFTWINLMIWVVVSLVGIIGGVRIYNIWQQNVERQRLLETLQKAQADLIAAERREGILAERGRLAREIHDTLAQGYIGVIMHLEAADEGKQTGVAEEKIEGHLKQAEMLAREGLRDARMVVQDLRPEILHSAEDLHSAIKEVAEKWTAQSGIPTEVTVTGDSTWTHPEVELTLLRTTQEGLSNILKHARATQVRLTISYIGDQVALDIEDNGIGIDHATPPDTDTGAGFGLKGMRERVEQMGGELFIESEPDEGTTLTVVCPTRLIGA